jgi:fatty-acyl-CoA synthase
MTATLAEDVALRASRRLHWVAHVERHAFAMGDAPALRFEGVTTTWSQLDARVHALAAALARRGVSAGDRVAVLMGNRPAFLETVLATNRLGAIAVPVNFRLAAGEIAYIVADSGSTLVFVDTLTVDAAREAVRAHGVTAELVATGVAASTGLTDYDVLLMEDGDPAPQVDVTEDSTALIMYTSGTTGHPKGVMLTHLNLVAQTQTMMVAYGWRGSGEVTLCASPMFHIGAIGALAPALRVGSTIAVLRSEAFDPPTVLDLMTTEHVSNVFLVPTQWQALCEEQAARPRDLSRLRVTSWGAAPASDTLLRRMAEVFPDATNVALFGQTEMSPVTCLLEGVDALRKVGSVGKAAPGVWARVVDAEMRDVSPGEVGEIVYRGPGTMTGYWNNPTETAAAFAGGWFHSGDLVRVDEEGFVYVVDRAKDMIISGGENIYCAEVENVLFGHPDIAEVAVVGRPHPRWGETPVAVAVLRSSSDGLTIEQLRDWADGALARYKLPTRLVVIDQLPRNASGKVVKGLLHREVEPDDTSVS